MGLFDSYSGGSSQWGGSGMMGGGLMRNPMNPWGSALDSLPGGALTQIGYWGAPQGMQQWQGSESQYDPYGRPLQQANPFSSFGPTPQGPAGGQAPMQPQQQQSGQMMQTGSPFNSGGTVLGYGGGMDASGKFGGQMQPQGGPINQAGGNMSPQQPSNPFAALGRFGW